MTREEREEKILALYKELNSTKKVAAEMNCSRPTIAKVLKKYNVLNRNEQNDTDDFKQQIVHAYTVDKLSTNDIKSKFHIGKPKIKAILQESGIEFRKERKNSVQHITEYYEKYPSLEGTNQIYLITRDGFEHRCKTPPNSTGFLTKYCEQHNLEMPTNDYQAREIFCKTEKYWWEEYFKVEIINDLPRKKCPYCDWSIEIGKNWKKGFIGHINNKHNKTKYDFITDNPHEVNTFKTKLDEFFSKQDNFVECKICGKKLTRIDDLHLKQHNITKGEYILLYGNKNLLAKNTYNKLKASYDKMREYMEEHPDCYINNKYEEEILNHIHNLGFTDAKRTRSVLENNKELDIYIPSKKIGIEFNGCYWHTERWKNDKNYHLQKTIECESKGIKLIQIFEDEYVNTKEIVLSKINHILGVEQDKPKIMGRKCEIKEISSNAARLFLDKNHIQQFGKGSVYLGAYFNDILIAVMACLRIKDGIWDLTRLASDYNYVCQGVASKLFKYFIKNYDPKEIKSFADRRWTLDKNNNIYTILGFNLEDILQPDYRYYSAQIHRIKRFHKFGFRKEILSKKFGLSMELSEKEMTSILGMERIWDCGLLKYVWRKNNTEKCK